MTDSGDTGAQRHPRVLGYLRVSTEEQVESGAGLAAQRSAIEAECARRGWDLLEVAEDKALSGGTLNRPGLSHALDRLDAGEADLLLAAKLDRLSRSVHDFTGIMRRAEKKKWALRVLDVDVDTSTPSGALLAHVVSATSEYERRIISERTRAGLAAKKAQGVRLGRPSGLPAAVVDRIVAENAAGTSLSAIARGLNAAQVPTGQSGSTWRATSVRAVLNSQAARKLA